MPLMRGDMPPTVTDSLGRRSGPRRTHAKSRGGCSACKRRRVKCDETRPACSLCVRRSFKCQYDIQSPNPRQRSSSEEPQPQTGIQLKGLAVDTESSPQPQQLDRPLHVGVPDTVPPSDTFIASDFALYHHFLHETVECFIEYPPETAYWRSIVPELAFQNPYMLHLILALAAMHQASIDGPTSIELMQQARAHFAASLPTIVSLMDEAETAKGSTLFMASSLISMYQFTQGPIPHSYMVFSDEGYPEPEWLGMFHGVKTMLMRKDLSFRVLLEHLQPLPTTPTAIATPGSAQSPGDGLQMEQHLEYRAPLATLRKLLLTMASEVPDCLSYIEALDFLIPVLDACFDSTFATAEDDKKFAHRPFQWLIKVPQEYLMKLQERKPIALILLAFFAALLSRTKVGNKWPVRGWPEHILDGIEKNIATDWDEYLQWPRMIFHENRENAKSHQRLAVA